MEQHPSDAMGSPGFSRIVWPWALGLGGLVGAGLGALLISRAWDGYLAANPGYLRDLVHPPQPSGSTGIQASLAVAMLTLGYLGALVASFLRIRRTGGGWMLLRALAALVPIPIGLLWAKEYFPFYASNVCGDCSPPEPVIPDVFAFANSVLLGAALLGPILFVMFVAVALVKLVRAHGRGVEPAQKLTDDPVR